MHPTSRKIISRCALVFTLFCPGAVIGAPDQDVLLAAFLNPPRQARLHCYWWWLNGNTDEATISRDLGEMKAKGYGGAILIDANGSDQFGNQDVPAGPLFGSLEWRKLYRHAVREAARLDLEISLTIQSGWNLGGPTVKPEQASKILTFSRSAMTGPGQQSSLLPQPVAKNGFYRDIAVLAYPLHKGRELPGVNGDERHPIRLLPAKAAFREFGMSMPVTTPLLEDFPSQPNEEDFHLNEVQNLTSKVDAAGRLTWNVPAGDWEILRIGYTDSDARVSTSSGGWQGLAIDHLDHTAFESYWNENVQPLINDAQPYVGKSLRYLVTDSWELGGTNWTSRFREEFQRRRGYDLIPYLPVVSGRIVESRDVSNRFLNDFRKTIGDLIRDEHYAVFARFAAQNGLGIHPESGGPHGAPIDALRTLGLSTFPQTEFWAKSATHRSTDAERFFVKEASSAAHTYGKTVVAGEGMTSIGPQWEEAIWNDLKPTFDQAICSGLNLLFWHTFTSAPKQFGLPGREYFAGTHLNPNVTWWNYAGPFIAYINRIQAVMQQGLPVADVLYYYGDRVPNFVQLKSADPAHVLPGYDYDVIDEGVLTSGLSVVNGRVSLKNGMSWRLLDIGDRPNISLDALRKVRDLVAAGATVIGKRPERTTGLAKTDAEVRTIAAQVWGNCGDAGQCEHQFGKGRVFCGVPADTLLKKRQILPDFEYHAATGAAELDYVQRRQGETDIYFIRNIEPDSVEAEVILRASAKDPELWHPDSGAVEKATVYQDTSDGRIKLPLALEPYGSILVVLRPGSSAHVPSPKHDVPNLPPPQTIEGNWTVGFPPHWGAPSSVEFPRLQSWTENTNPGIKYFSGTAMYSRQIDIPADDLRANTSLYLDLGDVREIARVTLNGKDLGIAWKKPFRIALDGAAKPGSNQLQVAVANLWPNRLIGDQLLPLEKRFTRTNITKFKADSPLLPSGLLGPVRLVTVAHL